MRHILLKGWVALMLFLCCSLPVQGQKDAYRLFTENGKRTKYVRLVKASLEADVVLFGELHNNPISHWLQVELTGSLFEAKGTGLVLGAEMFEADNQILLDEYFAGLISETKFEDEARLWKNYKTDYKPVVVFAKENDLRFIATNIPRRYANSVYKQGMAILDKLSDRAKLHIAPLPIEYDTLLNCYRKLMRGGGMSGHGSINLADAQAVKDATMAHFILSNRKSGDLFLHFNGAYHSDHYESINWFLKKAEPGLKIVTVTTVEQHDLDELEGSHVGKADFVICVPASMTKTH